MLNPISLPVSVNENGSTGFVTTRIFCCAKAESTRKQNAASATRRRMLLIAEGYVR